MKKGSKTALIIFGIVLLLGIIGFIAWGLTPLEPTNEALAAMESNANVTVQDYGNYIVFTGHPIRRPAMTYPPPA